MKKSIFIALLLLFSATVFAADKESAPPPPPNISITNNFGFAIDVTVCGTVYTINPGTTVVSPCTSAPCNISVKICTATINVTDPNCTKCNKTSTQNFPGTVAPYCPGFSVDWMVDCLTGDVIIRINP